MLASTPSAFAQGTYLSAPDGNPERALVVDNDGSVGIGTANPVSKLQVEGGTSDVAIRRGDGSAAAYLSGNPAVSGGNGALILYNTAGIDGVYLSSGASSYFTGGGYLGIGTREPRDRLSLGYGDSLSLDANDSSQTTRLRWRYLGNEYAWIEREHMTGDMVFGVERAERMRIDESGNVGIGTTVPNSRLHVEGDDVRFVRYGHSLVFNADAGGSATRAEIASDIGLAFSPGNTEKMRISPGGDVGIGTTDPQAKLDVAGKVNCQVLELTSDRAVKAGFKPVDRRGVLEELAKLPITTWHYTNAPDVRHIGPTAQDFKTAFPDLGSDDKHIATVDADGVLFAAVQALHEKLQETKAQLAAKDARIAGLEKELAEQKQALREQQQTVAARFSALEAVVAALKPKGDAQPIQASHRAGTDN
jgi:hypothetical protein